MRATLIRERDDDKNLSGAAVRCAYIIRIEQAMTPRTTIYIRNLYVSNLYDRKRFVTFFLRCCAYIYVV